jgi:translocation and assembly module TamB
VNVPSPAPPVPPSPRSRWRHARRVGVGSAILLVVSVLLLAWLFNTVAGRDVLLARIVAALPADATLTWRAAEGPAAGPMLLHDVHFAYHGHEFRAREVMLDPALRPLVWRKLRLDALRVRDARLDIAPDKEPFRLPQWPDSLPKIATPLPIQADSVEIDNLAVRREGRALIAISSLRAGVDVEEGRLHLENLRIESDRGRLRLHGDYAPNNDYRTALKGAWQVPARDGRPAARLGLGARGSLAAMNVEVRGVAPGPLRVGFALRGRQSPKWQLRSQLEGLDPGLFTGAATAPAWYASLVADGDGGLARLSGRARRDEFEVVVLPSIVRIQRQRLDLQPLALELLGGRATLTGRADFADKGNASLRGSVQARGLHWGEGKDEVLANGDFGVAGSTRQWAAIGKATLARAGQTAKLDFDARGNEHGLRLQRLRATMPSGRLDATGEVAWSPTLSYGLSAQLAGFDPGYFAPQWPGAVNGHADIDGTRRADGGLDTHVVLTELGGKLRTRPLSGHADLRIHGAAGAQDSTGYEGKLALRLGDSKVDAEGRITETLQVDANFEPLHLADLLPDSGGSLRGSLKLRGRRDAPDIDVDLQGADLHYGGWRAGTLLARGKLPWQTRVGGAGELHIEGSALALGLPFDTLRADARGSFEQLTVDARAAGANGVLELRGDLGRRGEAWQGRLAQLKLVPAQGAAWELDQAANFRWQHGVGNITPACLRTAAGGRLCVQGEWPRRGLDLHGTGLSLALLQGYLPEREGGGRWLLHGDLSLDAQLRPAPGDSWRGSADLRSASGGLAPLRRRASGRPPPADAVRYDALVVHADFDPAGVRATLGAGFDGHGRVDAQLSSGWIADSALGGSVNIATDQLGWLELFSPDIVAPKGRLQGVLQLGGTRAQPRLGGNAQLEAFTAELPALGITLREGTLRLDAQPDGNARLAGRVRSGDGVLNVQGTLGWGQESNPLQLRVTGTKVLASDTPELRAVVDPDLTVKYADGDTAVRVEGTVTLHETRLQLESLDQGARNSPDVVILDPEDDGVATGLPLDLDLDLVAGDDVRLQGFGLDGRTRGRLHVRAAPGREVMARGELQVEGTYVAYGQKLQVTRGRLLWSNGPISDPALDVRAQRTVGRVTAGVDVRGRASNPVATVWSDPATSQSDAIAYLALGRPLALASREEGQRVNAARSALSVGGNLLASQLGAKLGLDDAGVSQSRALGGEVIGAGKYLSPRLYVGYGVSLLGTGHVLTLKYLLRKGFDIEIESSSVENRASANWRIER